MSTHLLALQLMAVQGCLGAFDTLYHHELTVALPQRASAKKELTIHAARALIYSGLFIGLSSWAWHGAWGWVLVALFAVEILLTLWDFVIEDQTRLLPATERVTHTVLAINGGVFITLLLLNLPDWLGQPTALVWQPHGWWSVFLALCGVGVGISGVRDAFAAVQLNRQQQKEQAMETIHFSDTPQQVLVTGGTGFIGQLLVKALIKDGHSVTVLTRDPKKCAWLFDGQVRCIQRMDDLPASHRIDVIINLAGARILGWRWSEKRKRELVQSRVGTTQKLIEWIKRAEHKPKLLLSGSAIGYYGIQSHGNTTALTENTPPQPVFMSRLCQEWEASAKQASQHGVKVVCMRFGLVMGHQGALPMMILPIKLGLGGPLGDGQQQLSWIHVKDLLRAIAFLWQRHLHDQDKTAQAYNFTARESVTQGQFSKIAAQVVHRPCFLPTPAWPMRIMLGEQSDLLLEGQRVVPDKLEREGFVFRYPTLRAALQDLY